MDSGIYSVKQYYDSNVQAEWERLERHPFEFRFTTYMMDRYIQPGDSILDIGGGPGRYSLHYAQKGCEVTLVDLSDQNAGFAQEKAKELGVPLRAHAENCLALDRLELGQFDHVFLMGPLYHLLRRDERETAVRLALERLKPGGVFYASFILDFAGFIYDLKNGPGLLRQDLENPATARLLESIVSGTEYNGPAFTSACFINPKSIRPFLEPFGLTELHLFGQEGILAPNETQVLSYPKEEQELWIETAKKFLELPEFLAFSEHAMYIGRKPALLNSDV